MSNKNGKLSFDASAFDRALYAAGYFSVRDFLARSGADICSKTITRAVHSGEISSRSLSILAKSLNVLPEALAHKRSGRYPWGLEEKPSIENGYRVFLIDGQSFEIDADCVQLADSKGYDVYEFYKDNKYKGESRVDHTMALVKIGG